VRLSDEAPDLHIGQDRRRKRDEHGSADNDADQDAHLPCNTTALRSTLTAMRRVLVTGMSGTGKSSALASLGELGFQAIDTDEPGWTEWSDREGGYVWREDRIVELLARDDGPSLYVSGTVSNQGRFYSRFDAVVLLSAPADVLLSRIENRTTNPFGKTPEQREVILRDLAEVEPLLRRTCTHEIDATQPLTTIVAKLAELGRESPA
jgi:shikimate kinase